METISNPFLSLFTRLNSIESKLDVLVSKEQTQTEKRFYSITEAAKKLRVSPITLYRGIKSGRIPSKKIGSRVMLPGEFVDG